MNDPERPRSFFVGYAGKMPARYAALVRAFAIVTVILCMGTIGFVTAAQNSIDPGLFEFGVLRPFEGVLYAEPLPMLRTIDKTTGRGTYHVLVGATKVGAPASLLAHSGKKVSFQGTLIQRGSQLMIEYNSPDTLTVVGEPSAAESGSQSESLGLMTLRGEVVDTKCFFGAMRPATGKIHRGCAIRCLSGGVPPGLRVQDGDGHETIFLLAGIDGKPLNLDPQLAGLSVEVQGDVELQDNVAIVHTLKIKRIQAD